MITLDLYVCIDKLSLRRLGVVQTGFIRSQLAVSILKNKTIDINYLYLYIYEFI